MRRREPVCFNLACRIALTTSTPIEIANGAFGTTELHSFNTTSTTQTFNGVISGTGSYVRNASSAGTGGTTVFNAANTYSGGTNVSRGVLIVDNPTGSGSGTGTGAVAVGANGMLAGTGLLTGAVTVSGGSVSPGDTAGEISALAIERSRSIPAPSSTTSTATVRPATF